MTTLDSGSTPEAMVSLNFSPDGQHLLTATEKHAILVWNTASRTVEKTLEGHMGRIRNVAYSPDGLWIVSASYDNTVRLWNAQTGENVAVLPHNGPVTAVEFIASTDGITRFVSGSFDGAIRVWEIR